MFKFSFQKYWRDFVVSVATTESDQLDFLVSASFRFPTNETYMKVDFY